MWGDEPLLAQEAGDAIRAAARAAGCSERQVHTVAGAHFDWSGLLGAAQAMSLFADRQLIEIRIPVGQAGQGRLRGAAALLRDLVATTCVTLVQLPRLDRTQQSSAWFTALDARRRRRCASIRSSARRCRSGSRSAWPRRASACTAARRASARSPSLPTASRATCSPRTRRSRSSACCTRQGELSFEQIEAAVLNVARYDVFKLGEAVLAGQVARALRMLDGLQAEGEAAVLVHWTLAEDIRALKRVKDALDGGKPLPMALRESRVWGAQGAPVRARRAAADRQRAGAPASTPRSSATAWSRA